MVFNKDELHAPTWMDQSFFERTLRHAEHDSALQVQNFRIVPGTKPGDHFASVIFRAIVTYTSRDQPDQEMSLIIKTLPTQEGVKKDLLKDGVVFETETLMYTVVIPAMQQLLQSVGDQTVLGARLLYYSKDPNWVMVFQDITKLGYEMKPLQLDFEESKVVFAKLARWHATSMFLADTLPAIKSLTLGLYPMLNDIKEFLQMWQTNIEMLADLLPEWPGCEKYAEPMRALKERIFDRVADIYTYDESSLIHVLNHGDCHSKNMLFKYTEGKLDDIMLLDFQLSVWGTPAIDLIYAMYNAASVETKEKHRDDLIMFYHEELIDTLRKIGYLKKLPTLHEVQIEILKCGHLEILLSATFVPFMIEDFTTLIDIPEDGFELDFAKPDSMVELVKITLNQTKYKDFMTKVLPEFQHKGYLTL